MDIYGAINFAAVLLVAIISVLLQFIVKEPKARTAAAPAATAAAPAGSNENRTSGNETASEDSGVSSISAPAADGNPQPSAAAVARPLASQAKAAPKLYYLGNLKAFLTMVVVIHHSGSANSGDDWIGPVLGGYDCWAKRVISSALSTDQSYFMALFFFISAYFTPTSFERKGAALFFKEKLKRIGLPMSFFGLVLGPLLVLTMVTQWLNYPDIVAIDAWPQPGPCWYLFWLLMFSGLYALVYPYAPSVKCGMPSLCILLLVGAFIGLYQTAVLMATDGTRWGNVLFLKLGFAPMYVVFWTAGIVARRNQWLDEITNLSRQQIYAFYGVSLAFVIATYIICIGVNGDHWYTSWQVVFGMMCMTISVSEIYAFHRYFNTNGAVSRFFSDAAYAVYLIHPWIVTPIQQSYIMILRAHGEEIVFGLNTTVSTSELSNPALLLLGWLYTATLASLVVWPLGWCLKQAPGLRDII